MASQRIWFVRAGVKAVHVDEFLTNGEVAIGWGKVGEIAAKTGDDEIQRRFRAAYPDKREGSVNVWLAQVKRFLREIRVGDEVVTYDPGQRTYFLGVVESDVTWRQGHDLPRVRKVKWSLRVRRDLLSTSTRNSLGSIATFFRVNNEASDELRTKAVAIDATEEPEAAPTDDKVTSDETMLREEVIEKAEQFIEDRIAALDWKEMQELVAGILRAMGHRTRVADAGPDRGVDIFASPDGLGLQEPRIFVEVKHRPGTTTGAQEVRSFLGGRQAGDRCLYVSTGGFTKDAKYEAERASVPMTLITLPQLRELLVEHYENLDPDVRTLVPMTRLYWPVEE